MNFYNKTALQLRKNKKINTGFIAKMLEISPSTLWSWESGRRNPSEKNVRMLAEMLGVPVSKISDLKDNINLTQKSKLTDEIENITNIFAEDKELSLINQNKNALEQIGRITTELGYISSLFKAILKNINMIFYVKDVNLKYVIANKSFLENLSLNNDYNVIGKEDKDFFSSEDAKQMTSEDKNILLTETPLIQREGYIPGSRKKKIGLFSKFPLYDSFGNLTGIVGIIDDITKRYRESQIRKLLENALNYSNDVIFLRKATKSRKQLYISDTVEALYGYPKSCFFEDPLFWETKCLHPEDKNIAVTFSDICLSSKIKKYRIIRKDGTIRNIEANVLCHEIHGEKYVCAIERDITDKQQPLN